MLGLKLNHVSKRGYGYVLQYHIIKHLNWLCNPPEYISIDNIFSFSFNKFRAPIHYKDDILPV